MLLKLNHVYKQLIKDLLTKERNGKNKQKKFSGLITDILEKEKLHRAVSVLKSATYKFQEILVPPPKISRLYCTKTKNLRLAEKWVKTVVARAPINSYVADTLGQVYKKRLIQASKDKDDILKRAKANGI